MAPNQQTTTIQAAACKAHRKREVMECSRRPMLDEVLSASRRREAWYAYAKDRGVEIPA